MKKNIKQAHAFAYAVKQLIIEISYKGKTGHIGSALSISDIVSVLYSLVLRISSQTVTHPKRDRFILSKGHAAAALYAALYKKRMMSRKQLFSFADDTGGLCEHPEIKTPGIEMTTGSLGNGLGFASGIAFGLLQTYGIEKSPHVYVLISDGECGEGSVWEAALFASRMHLANLTVIVDYNTWQCFGKSDEITHLAPFADKWKSFGWDTREADGHNITELYRKLSSRSLSNKPTCIICHTVMGKGISFIEDKLIGHYKVLTQEEFIKAKIELQKGKYA